MIVLFRLPDLAGEPQWRPAMLLHVEEDGAAELTVFLRQVDVTGNKARRKGELQQLGILMQRSSRHASVTGAKQGALVGCWSPDVPSAEEIATADRQARLIDKLEAALAKAEVSLARAEGDREEAQQRLEEAELEAAKGPELEQNLAAARERLAELEAAKE